MSSNWPELHWRPSRLVVAALVALGVLATCSVLLSGLPAWLAPAAALPAWVAGWRQARRAPRVMRFGAGGVVCFAGADGAEAPATLLSLDARGPLLVLRARVGGRSEALAFAPDTLSRAAWY